MKGSTRYVCLFVKDEVSRSFVILNDTRVEMEVELSEVEFPTIEGREAGTANCPWPSVTADSDECLPRLAPTTLLSLSIPLSSNKSAIVQKY